MLKLSDIRKDLTFTIQKGLAMHYLSALATGRYNIILDFDVYLPTKGMNLQREFCWTLEQKQELILSVMKGIKLASIAVIIKEKKSGEKNYQIIDGKQRLSTLISFWKGEFPMIFEGKEYFFKDLDEWAKREIEYMMPLADVAYEDWELVISDDQKIAWFEMINFAGTPQDKEHLNNLKK